MGHLHGTGPVVGSGVGFRDERAPGPAGGRPGARVQAAPGLGSAGTDDRGRPAGRWRERPWLTLVRPGSRRLPVPTRALFARLLLGAGVLCAAALALVGGVVLRAPGVIAVVLAGAVSACLAAGLARETTGPTRTPPLDAAAQAAGCTIGALLALAGTAAVAGGI